MNRPQRRRLCGAALALPALALLPRARAADPETFTFRGRAYAPTGSSVTRRMTWTGPLPFDRAYDALTPAQLAWIRDQYEKLEPDEEPPFPRDGLRVIFDEFDLSIDANTPRLDPGPVVVVVKIDDKGAAESVAVYKSPQPFVTTAISRALMAAKYKPARRGGAPVAMPFLLKVELQ